MIAHANNIGLPPEPTRRPMLNLPIFLDQQAYHVFFRRIRNSGKSVTFRADAAGLQTAPLFLEERLEGPGGTASRAGDRGRRAPECGSPR